MKKFYLLILVFFVSINSFGQLISEFEPNPAGTDPATSSIELSGAPSAAFTGYIVSIENDGINGIVDRSAMVSGTFDTNGLLVVNIPDLENPSFTLVLCSVDPGLTTDLDTNDDGTIDNIAVFGTIYDTIGIPDSAADAMTMYGTQLGGTDFAYTGDEPGLVFRDGNTGDWYAINEPAGTDAFDINAATVPFTNFSSNPSISTFGSTNPTNIALSVDEFDQNRFSIYPNPTTNGQVHINSSNSGKIEIAVFDLLGKRVLTNTIFQNSLDVSSLKSGVYILNITQNGFSETQKLIVR